MSKSYRMRNNFYSFIRDLDMEGAFVRITREQQIEIDEQIAKDALLARESRTGAISKCGKRIFAQVEEDEDPVPAAMYINAKMLRIEIARHVDNIIAQWSAQEAQMRLDRLESMWRKIGDFWESLGSSAMSLADADRCAQFCSHAWDEYLPYKVKLQRLIEQEQRRSGVCASTMGFNAGNQLIQIQLSEPPKLSKFSGNEIDWANFRAIFEAEVHRNTRFSNTQKMNLLLGALQGRAAAAYANWPIINESSYETLWADICNRYSNEYNTIRAHLQALNTLTPIQKPTCEAMRKIIDVARGSFRQLQLLLKPELTAEYMLLYQIEGLLDAESQVQWSLRRSTNALPTLAQLFDFMELRASTLWYAKAPSTPASAIRSDNSPSISSSLAAQRGFSIGRGEEQRPPCDLCPGQMHWPFKCSRFESKSILDRTNYTTLRQMCQNCFSLKHKTKQCPDKGCFKCKKLHNSCLCPLNTTVAGSLLPLEDTKKAAATGTKLQ